MSINENYIGLYNLIREEQLDKAKIYIKDNNFNINVKPTLYDPIAINCLRKASREIKKYFLEETPNYILAFLNTAIYNGKVYYVPGIYTDTITATISY